MPLQRQFPNISLAVLLAAAMVVGPAWAEDDRSIALVLDASGSMWAKLPDGTTRMDAAKAAVAKLVDTLPAGTRLSFRAYGHQSPPKAKNCQDTALLAPFANVTENRKAVVAQAHDLKPLGYTPITHALTLAAEDLAAEETVSRVVVLVSDGKETCDADPCAAAEALAAADADLVVHTVGAGVDAETRSQLQCIADRARGTYFDANSAAELGTVMAQAAETKAREAPQPSAPETPISTKAASKDQNGPVPIEAGEVVKGRLGESMYHYWKINAPAGKYRVVLDVKRSDDKSSNIQSEVMALGPDGTQVGEVVDTNAIGFRFRDAAEIDTESQPDLVLRVGNDTAIVDYWLGLFPADAEVASPYFVRTPRIEALEFGNPVSAVLDPKPGAPAEAWYSVSLQATDYRITAEFKRSDGKDSNVQAQVDMFGPIGEHLKGIDQRVCHVNEIDVTATCVAKLVLADDAQVLFRLSPDNEAGYKATFKIEPFTE